MGVIGKLKVMLGLDSSEFIKNAKKAKQANEELDESLRRTREGQQNAPDPKPLIDPKQTDESTKKMNMLNMSIQQVARELPSLAMGPQMFFLAISNNLPMLTDEIARAREEYAKLTKEGQKATPVWKQVISGIVSWQTALVVAITLLVAYGKDIANFFSELFTGKKAFDAAAVAAQNFNNAMQEGRLNAVEELTKLDLLYGIATDVTETYDKRKSAVEKLQEIYPAYFANMTTEKVLAGQAVAQYDNLRASILKIAEARAALNTLTSAQGDIQTLEQTGAAFDDLRKKAEEARKAKEDYENAPQQYMVSEKGYSNITPEKQTLMMAERALDKANDRFKEKLLSTYNGKELWEKIEEQFNGNAVAFFESATSTINQLQEKAGESLTMITPEDENDAYQKGLEAYKKYKQEREEINKSTLAYEEAANKKEIEFLQSQQDEYGNTLVYLQRLLQLRQAELTFAKTDERRKQIEAENKELEKQISLIQGSSGSSFAEGSEGDLKKRISDLRSEIQGLSPIADRMRINEAMAEINALNEQLSMLPQNYKIQIELELDNTISGIEGDIAKQLDSNDFLNGLKSQAEMAEQISQELMATLSSTMQDAFSTLAETLGGVSDLNANEAVSALLMPLADMAIAAGTIIMLSGDAIEALKAALEGFFGVGAIAAGAILVGIGVAAKAGLSALAKGGSSGSTAASYNTYTGGFSGGYSNNGAYTSKVPDLVQAAGTNVTVDVSGSLKGEDIALAVKKVTYNKSR